MVEQTKKIMTIFFIAVFCILTNSIVFAEQGEKSMKTVRTAAFDDQAAFFSRNEITGVRSGYVYQFLTDISDYETWDFEYIDCGWSEAMDMLLNGSIDVMAAVSYSDKLASKMLFSKLPMGTESYHLFTASDSKLVNVSELNDRKIGVLKDSVEEIKLKDFLEENHITSEIIFYEFEEDIKQALKEKDIDAFVGVDIQFETGYRSVARIGESEYYFAINKSRPDLKKELDEAMEEIMKLNPYYILELSKKYMDNAQVMRNLSEEEKKWLSEKQIIRLGYITGCMPYCTLGDGGKVQGLLGDIVATIKKNYKTKVECVSYNDSEIMAKDLKSGLIDVAFALTDNEWVADTNGLALCNTFTNDSSVIMYKGYFSNCLYGKLAITRENSFDLPCFQTNLPDVKFEIYDDDTQCLQAVLDSEVDGYITHANRAYYIANQNTDYYALKIASINEQSSYNFVVAKTSPELYRIFNHVNNFYSEEKISHLLSHYTIDDNEVTFKEYIKNNAVSFLSVTLLICIFIVLIAVAKNYRIRKLYSLSYIDALTGINNRNAFEKKIELLKVDRSQSLGVIFADINGLKQINDNQGHAAGDKRIQKAAECLTKSFNKKDTYRISGDEFVIIWPNCKKEAFENTFHEMIDYSTQSLYEIISAGMIWSDDTYDIQEMICTAEAEMYEMKKIHYSKYPNDRRQNRAEI